ncbi:MAG: DUF3019 domain-containing protein [Gammaproteobacteria bacterium]|nr:DUF3019 domain-containing protein [Gammaproteobacteria bacterium]MBU2205902.1 DUF3019 domain-containing protein [Gammaproteobacteria bacterium]
MSINKSYCYILILAGCLWPGCAAADQLLQLTPATCVTLQQGRSCHTQVQVSWQLPKADNVCLYLQQQVLHCWQNSAGAQWRWRFEHASSQQLTLWQLDTNGQPSVLLDSASVEVNWVHNAQKKRLWRRF